jgi:tetratricopeptide (TPR) repeat protein
MHLRERRYDEAIADYDVAIRLCPSEQPFKKFYYSSRGEAKMHKGDFSGALDDFNKALWSGSFSRDTFYNRGFVYEKLGNIESALSNYDMAIANAKQFRDKPPVVSSVPRKGYDDESRRMVYQGNRFGYVISFEELVEIRERLAEQSGTR